jgi:phosphomannomutase
MNWNLEELDQIFKAYDVRGIYPEQINEELCYQTGRAFVEVLKISANLGGPNEIVVGHDMRPSGPALAQAFARGVCDQGVDVIMIGLCSTDGLYFASGKLNLPGAMFTASHNPAQYNGIKLAKQGAAPVGEQTGLAEIKNLVLSATIEATEKKGSISHREMAGDYAKYLHSLVDLKNIRPLKLVIDAGNGMGGFTVPKVLQGLNLNITPMYFELDGNFPNHEANPIDPKNLVDLQKQVKAVKADLGIAFDGDADRAFFIDEAGQLITPSAITALIAARELAREPGAAIIYNLITSRAVAEVVQESGGQPIKTRVGHSFIKKVMKDNDAIFGGEHSGHFYFRDFWFADSGMLAALHVIAALGESDRAETISAILAKYNRYFASGEINTKVSSPQETIKKVSDYMKDNFEVSTDELDGVTYSHNDWWVNVRPSNTEPLLRFNSEAKTVEMLDKIRDSVLAVIREDAV